MKPGERAPKEESKPTGVCMFTARSATLTSARVQMRRVRRVEMPIGTVGG
jgi:hypothetical protein